LSTYVAARLSKPQRIVKIGTESRETHAVGIGTVSFISCL
jgi:hypothetical protein